MPRNLAAEPLCQKPKVGYTYRKCGCPETIHCLSCGRVDQMESDYHREICKQFKEAR